MVVAVASRWQRVGDFLIGLGIELHTSPPEVDVLLLCHLAEDIELFQNLTHNLPF